VNELAAEFGVSRRTMYRALPQSVRRGEIRALSDEARGRQGAGIRNWHSELQARRLRGHWLRNGEVIETGRNVRWRPLRK